MLYEVITEIFTRLGIGRSTFLAWVKTVRPIVAQLDEMGLDGHAIMKSNLF